MRPVLLRNGLVFDGTGAAPFRGSVLVVGGRICWVGQGQASADAEVIDCTDLAIAPGFIDGHSHSDLQLLDNRFEKLLQGVTTEVVGNCGFSPFPAAEDRAALHDFAGGILSGGGDWGWAGVREYLDAITKSCAIAGVLPLVGHGTLRIRVAGHKLGPLNGREQSEMEALLDDALASGAAGLSTGLMYSPGAAAPPEELERLCSITARRGKIYATHMRDYGDQLIEAVDEQLELARRTGCRLQISHLQAVGRRNWPRQRLALERIEAARTRGMDVAFDCYPYTRGSTVLTQLLPQQALEGGSAKLLVRLRNPAMRAEIAQQTDASLAQGWGGILIAAVGSTANQGLIGKSIAEVAATRDVPPVQTALDLLIEEDAQVMMLEINQSEDNLRQILAHPLSNIISDGFYVRGRPHPRLHGTFPYLLGAIARERQWISVQEAVRKITCLPAERFRLQETGSLKKDFYADITVFNPNTVGSAATYENPEMRPDGIEYVFRRGKMLVRQQAVVVNQERTNE